MGEAKRRKEANKINELSDYLIERVSQVRMKMVFPFSIDGFKKIPVTVESSPAVLSMLISGKPSIDKIREEVSSLIDDGIIKTKQDIDNQLLDFEQFPVIQKGSIDVLTHTVRQITIDNQEENTNLSDVAGLATSLGMLAACCEDELSLSEIKQLIDEYIEMGYKIAKN